MRRLLTVLAAAALVAVVVIGLSQAGDQAPEAPEAPSFDLAEARRSLQGAPTQLAGLHAQSGEVLEGGKGAFERRLRALEGRPVVINKWASWCGPCRSEFPYFQRVATERGKEIAFLGLNSGDQPEAATRFLDRYPVPFPSYSDPREDIARAYKAGKYYPMTIFLDERGEIAFVHPGEYRSEADLEADIERYL